MLAWVCSWHTAPRNAITSLVDCQCTVFHCSFKKETREVAICGINTQGATLSFQICMGCRVRDSPWGVWPVNSLQPFCWNPGWETSYPSGINSHSMRQKEKKKQDDWCAFCVVISTYTQVEAQMCMYSHTKMNGHLHVHQPTQVFAHQQKHGHKRYYHKVIFQRIVDEKCLSSMSFLANLHGERRGID